MKDDMLFHLTYRRFTKPNFAWHLRSFCKAMLQNPISRFGCRFIHPIFNLRNKSMPNVSLYKFFFANCCQIEFCTPLKLLIVSQLTIPKKENKNKNKRIHKKRKRKQKNQTNKSTDFPKKGSDLQLYIFFSLIMQSYIEATKKPRATILLLMALNPFLAAFIMQEEVKEVARRGSKCSRLRRRKQEGR